MLVAKEEEDEWRYMLETGWGHLKIKNQINLRFRLKSRIITFQFFVAFDIVFFVIESDHCLLGMLDTRSTIGFKCLNVVHLVAVC